MAGKGKRQRTRTMTVDLEALGLVALALGVAMAGLLIPRFPTGELGTAFQRALAGRVGWGAYLLPWPFVVLGGFFLFRRNPPAWPRVTFGYLLSGVGAWGVLMLVHPSAAGAWGAEARAWLTGAGGWLMAVPALLAFTLGLEAMLGLRPTRIVRSVLLGLMRATRRAGRWALAARRSARARAAFRADVALVRKDLTRVQRDLAALAGLYPGSAELTRWREQVQELKGRLRGADGEMLDEARADAASWRAAVDAFTADRAEDLVAHLRAEGVRDFFEWARTRAAYLAGGVEGASQVAQALDGVRKALALDLTALDTRYRRLTRERDQAEAALARASASSLVTASQAHAARRQAYHEVADAAEALERDAEHLETWRDLVGDVQRLLEAFPDEPEVHDLDGALAEDLRARGRAALSQQAPWAEAVAAVEARAQEARRRAKEEAVAAQAVAAQAGAASSPGRTGVSDEALLGPADVPAGGEEDTATPDAETDAETDADAPPFDPTGQEADGAVGPSLPRGGSHAVRPSATRDADDMPEVGGIPIQLPRDDLLDPGRPHGDDPEAQRREVEMRVRKIDQTLANFNLQGRVVSSVRGPTVTRFEVEPAPGEKIARFSNLADDLALAMAASSVRIEAPIPGKSVIGLEVPNADRDLIRFREAVESPSYARAKARLPLILGKSIDGQMWVGDLAKMPHLLIAGSTGSGKSVAVNTMIASLVFKFLPTDLRLLMIDPKMVELTPFDGAPHLIRPVVTNPADAAGVLLGAVSHMERRYKMMSRIGAKNLDQYNEKARNLDLPHLPFVVIVIDELADLMITSPKEVESAIMRLAQMARATGMHLILATQRPSVDILTSLIKVNVPARVAFAVSSSHDSRTILDTMGAERLVGLGDMLFYQPGLVKPARLQGPFVSEDEIAALAAFLRRQYFDDEFVEAYAADFEPVSADESEASGLIDWNDDKLRVAAEMVINEQQASVSRLQRRLSVGHARAGKLMDSLEALGVVGSHVGSKPREVLVALEDLPDIFGR
ncbi:MAG: DNA translocase FtsK [Trueperaceae bacterium]|nr:DNA translocase FtsK [Trueperaceae bacterium]